MKAGPLTQQEAWQGCFACILKRKRADLGVLGSMGKPRMLFAEVSDEHAGGGVRMEIGSQAGGIAWERLQGCRSEG